MTHSPDSERLSLKWYNCIQYTRRRHRNLSSFYHHGLCQSWPILKMVIILVIACAAQMCQLWWNMLGKWKIDHLLGYHLRLTIIYHQIISCMMYFRKNILKVERNCTYFSLPDTVQKSRFRSTLTITQAKMWNIVLLYCTARGTS